ncbi:MAG: hypothetical protein GC206_11575 [Alphaproteobacteria bacterium]|nr:hypothetical protein [Alphaproteobacteria bacterium]
MKALSSVFSALGVVVAVLSIVSLAQRWFTLTLSEAADDVLGYYRTIADQAKWLLFDWWTPHLFAGWTPPSWVIDAIALWALATAAVLRGVSHVIAERNRFWENDFAAPEEAQFTKEHVADAVLFAPLRLIQFLIRQGQTITQPTYLYVPLPFHFNATVLTVVSSPRDGDLARLRANAVGAIAACFAPVLAAAAFFFWNAFML